MRIVDASKTSVLDIGFAGEKDRTRVKFYYGDLAREFPGGSVVIQVSRPGENTRYDILAEFGEDGYAWWTVSNYDVALEGFGACQLIYSTGDKICKRKIWKTAVNESLTGANVSVPPDWADYAATLLNAAGAVQESLSEAQEYIDSTMATLTELGETIQESAQTVAGATQSAEAAAAEAQAAAADVAEAIATIAEKEDLAADHASDAQHYAEQADLSATAAHAAADEISGSLQRVVDAAASVDQLVETIAGYDSTSYDSMVVAAQSEAGAYESALKAEGHAVGNQDGTAVGNDSPYYHNNAKYYAENAAASAQAADQDATTASGAASDASSYADHAHDSELSAAQSASDARTYAANAQTLAGNALSYANNAADSATDAQNAKTSATSSKNSAQTSAEKAEGHAVGNQDGTAVGNDSPYYHNNAKYYAQVAADFATAAESAKNTAIQTTANIQATARGNVAIFAGTCTNSSDVIAKTVTCPDYDRLVVGDMIYVTFSNNVIHTQITMNVNGTGDKPVKRRIAGTSVADLIGTDMILSGRPQLFSYDGTNWVLEGTTIISSREMASDGYTSDTIYPLIIGKAENTVLNGTARDNQMYRYYGAYMRNGRLWVGNESLPSRSDVRSIAGEVVLENPEIIDTYGDFIHDQYSDDLDTTNDEYRVVVRVFVIDPNGYVMTYAPNIEGSSYNEVLSNDGLSITISGYDIDNNLIANYYENASLVWEGPWSTGYDGQVCVPYWMEFPVKFSNAYTTGDAYPSDSLDHITVTVNGIGNSSRFSLYRSTFAQQLDARPSTRDSIEILNVGIVDQDYDSQSDFGYSGFKIPDLHVYAPQDLHSDDPDYTLERVIGYQYSLIEPTGAIEYESPTELRLIRHDGKLYIGNMFLLEEIAGYDTAPTYGSGKLVTSGGVYNFVKSETAAVGSYLAYPTITDVTNRSKWAISISGASYREGMTVNLYFLNTSYSSNLPVYLKLNNLIYTYGSSIMMDGLPLYKDNAEFSGSCATGSILTVTLVGNRWIVH